MLTYQQQIGNKEIIEIIHKMCDHVDPRLIDHGFRVSYLVSKMLEKSVDITDPAVKRDICLLALLHDVGAYKTEEIDRLVQFETHDVWSHSIYGYLFTKYFSPLADLSIGILYHHVSWSQLCSKNYPAADQIRLAQLLHLADRFDVMYMSNLDETECRRLLLHLKGSQFDPDLVQTLLDLDLNLEQYSHPMDDPDYEKMLTEIPFSNKEIDQYFHMIISIIDFASRHTVTHTLTAAGIAYELAVLMNLDEQTCSAISCGALLHDLGKIAIPLRILESPGRLSPEDMEIMKSHVVYTNEILEGVISDQVRKIAVRHHEKPDGSGYPDGLPGTELNLPERIVAVADITSALSGTRSYKKGFDKQKVLSILWEMSQKNQIDPAVTACITSHFDTIMRKVDERCAPTLKTYEAIIHEFIEIQKSLPEQYATTS